ncbi:hypothetical protein R3P38DRAFT_554714 [Favolaschia claudopus]|uniref:Secreted protein n=1 Tax=Favolaschia claudopus TaxID=2862362 RepID=A0AAV9ZAN9_9AGAR
MMSTLNLLSLLLLLLGFKFWFAKFQGSCGLPVPATRRDLSRTPPLPDLKRMPLVENVSFGEECFSTSSLGAARLQSSSFDSQIRLLLLFSESTSIKQLTFSSHCPVLRDANFVVLRF